jgi:hypothetical protein
MADRDSELVKVTDHVPGSVKPRYGRLLPLIDFEGSGICASSAQGRSEF